MWVMFAWQMTDFGVRINVVVRVVLIFHG